MPRVVRLLKNPADGFQLYSSQQEGRCIGTISIPIRDQMNASTAISLIMSAIRSWVKPNEYIQLNFLQGSILTAQRNELVQRMQGDWILFIDDDMLWGSDAIRQLVEVRQEFDLDMVSGLCFQRRPPHQPTLYMRESPTSGGYSFDSDPEMADPLAEIPFASIAVVVTGHRREDLEHPLDGFGFLFPRSEGRRSLGSLCGLRARSPAALRKVTFCSVR